MSLLSPFPRSLLPELMDDPRLDAAHHQAALRGLARLNRVSGGVGATWKAIARLCRTRGLRTLRLLDVACGAGDVPVGLARRAARAGIDLSIDACDLSDRALQHARSWAEEAGVTIRFFQCDALAGDLPSGYDVVASSLFLHHLTSEQSILLLRGMAGAATRLVVINDLARTRLNTALVSVAARLVSSSHVVHADGPQSVRAAFSPAEIRELCHRAGLTGARVQRQFPCRLMMAWEKPS